MKTIIIALLLSACGAPTVTPQQRADAYRQVVTLTRDGVCVAAYYDHEAPTDPTTTARCVALRGVP